MTLPGKPIEELVTPLMREPATGAALRVEGDHFVTATGARYPIVNGIPRFVPGDMYVESFSFEWNTHSNTQLDAWRGDRSSEEQFVQKTGFTSQDIRGKLVLDAGVGAGRYADVASRWGANLVGVDLSFAVEASHRNFLDRPNVFVMQADIGNLPFAPASFDYIFSIGVLHHTPDTKTYFERLVPLLKPGGDIAIWVYPKEGEYVIRNEWIPFVNKIPPKMFYAWCRWFVPWMKARKTSPLAAALGYAFPISKQDLGMENDILDTFDGFSPKYHGIHSPQEVEGWFRDAGLVNIRQPSRWNTCVRGTKPGAST